MKREPSESVFLKYREGSCTPAERQRIEAWYLSQARDMPINYENIQLDRVSARLERHLSAHVRKRKAIRRLRLAAAAAAAVLVVSASLLYWIPQFEPQGARDLTYQQILPGTNKATLELVGGDRSIALDASKLGIVIDADGIRYEDGSGIWDSTLISQSQWVKVTVPKGGQYQLTLQDGSRVWLNAESELRYPVSFADHGREITLAGEGYFEIAPARDRDGKRIAFVVNAAEQQVEVLGTQFNISAYTGEPTYTTLLEGSVQVASIFRPIFKRLIPNEQAVVHKDRFEVRKVDPEAAVAWKNGYFLFEDESLNSIAKKISRWYDVEVVLDGISGDRKIWGSVSKYAQVSTLMEALAMTGTFTYEISGRRIRIMK